MTSANLSQTTYERLREMILDGTLRAGTTLQEKMLAEKLGVSRTPVREATARLVNEGLVSRTAGFTPVVRRLSTDDFIEILHVRRLLEVEAAGRAAASGRAGDLYELRARIVGFISDAPPTPEEHMRADDQLHETLANMAGSRLLASMIHDLRLKTHIFDMGRVPERFRPGSEEHIEIIDAVLAHDAERAQNAMRTHIDNAREAILQNLKRLF